jgi:hypothetical protein
MGNPKSLNKREIDFTLPHLSTGTEKVERKFSQIYPSSTFSLEKLQTTKSSPHRISIIVNVQKIFSSVVLSWGNKSIRALDKVHFQFFWK